MCLLYMALSSKEDNKCERRTDGAICDGSAEDGAMKYSTEMSQIKLHAEDSEFTDAVAQDVISGYVTAIIYTYIWLLCGAEFGF
jgi:hypothetical protein